MMETNPADRISGLPEEIIHCILSFLPTAKDVYATSVLSKTFQSAFTSFFSGVVLDYEQIEPGEDRWQQFKNLVRRTTQRMKLEETHVDKFQLFVRSAQCKDLEDNRVIDKAVCFVVKKGVKYLSLHTPPFCEYNLPVVRGSSFSIKTLELTNMGIHSLDHLIASCPVIEMLCVDNCDLFRNFKLSSTTIRCIEFKSCNEELQDITIESPSLKKFVYIVQGEHYNSSGTRINIRNCTSLEVLDIEYVGITNKWVARNIPRLVKLQNLKLAACHNLMNLRISNGSLKTVELLQFWPSLLNTKIKGQNIKSLKLDGVDTRTLYLDSPKLVSFIASEIRGAEAIVAIKRSFRCGSNDFLTLRNFIQDFVKWCCPFLTINSTSDEDLVIPKKIRGLLVGPILTSIKRLRISGLQNISVELVDSLLWLFPLAQTIQFDSDSNEAWGSIHVVQDPKIIKNNKRKRQIKKKIAMELGEEVWVIKPDDLTNCCLDT